MPSEDLEDVQEDRLERTLDRDIIEKTRTVEKYLDGEEMEYSWLRRLISVTLSDCYIDDEEDMSVHYAELPAHDGAKARTCAYIKYEDERVFHASFYTLDSDPLEEKLDTPPDARMGLRTYKPGKWEDRLDELYREALDEKREEQQEKIEERFATV